MMLSMQQQLSSRSRTLDSVAKLLKSYSHEGVLERGFALVLNDKGLPVRSVSVVNTGHALTVQVADGRFGVVVSGSKPAKQPGQTSAKTSDLRPQTDLFS
jgi:exodeoxyribonuclease VII large subunit